MASVNILDSEEKKRLERIGYQRKLIPGFSVAESGGESVRQVEKSARSTTFVAVTRRHKRKIASHFWRGLEYTG